MKRPWSSLATRHSYQGASWARAKGPWCAGPTTRQSRQEVDDEDQADASRVHATLLSAPSVVEATEAVPLPTSDPVKSGSPASEPHPDEVLDWNQIFIDTLQGRVLAESVRSEGYAPLWDEGKLEAMKGRVLAESVRSEDPAVLWDPGRLEAMEGRVLAA
jgi:hypothetical protein